MKRCKNSKSSTLHCRNLKTKLSVNSLDVLKDSQKFYLVFGDGFAKKRQQVSLFFEKHRQAKSFFKFLI
jgi:hypothetical protein